MFKWKKIGYEISFMIKEKIMSKYEKWQVLGKVAGSGQKPGVDDIVDILLKNRKVVGQKQKRLFFNPPQPEDIDLIDFEIDKAQVKKAIKRLELSKKKKEKIVIYGDYDADGICATAILWECLDRMKLSAWPHIPDRFSEGYGLNADSVKELKRKYPDLGIIVTVDNGIVANDAVDVANVLGVDIIITDHHQKGKRLPDSCSVIHTDKISGAAIAWVLAREIRKTLKAPKPVYGDGLDLAAIGTIADQIPLIGINRSFAKYGLDMLKKTKRAGLLALYQKAGINKSDIGTYHVGFLIGPRINAMGRLEHGIDSLRLLCTRDKSKAEQLSGALNNTNYERQKIVNDVVVQAESQVEKKEWGSVILLAHENYHEGVIGLAASRLVEKYYRPAIVISRGKKISKASARSIAGFNIIDVIRELDDILEDGGGHPMAAGFSIRTEKIEVFEKKLHQISKPLLTDEVLSKVLKIDIEIGFSVLGESLYEKIESFEPTGANSPTPLFVARKVGIADARVVGRDSSHLKMKLEQGGVSMDAIAFGFGDIYPSLSPGIMIDVVFSLDMNVWNGISNLQLKIKDIKENVK